MNIEILGVDPKNKGAGLMLDALKSRLSERYPQARFCVSLSFDTDARVQNGLWGILPKQSKKKELFSKTAESLIPTKVFKKFGVIKSEDIDVVVDASGFAYGDFWGAGKLERRLGQNVENWKRDGKKIIVMPQAWGPFTDQAFSESVKKVVKHANVIFARDCQSLGHLEAISGKCANLSQAPDFTNVLETPVPKRLLKYAGSTFVIPNEKVIASFGEEARDSYLTYLSDTVTKLKQAQHSVVLLVHEGKKDLKLATEILERSKSSGDVEILNLQTPIETKAVISISRAIVSSRFHGLVSALAAGVPSLACGWSHKYEELLGDYNCKDFVVDFNDISERERRTNEFLIELDKPEFREMLSQASAKQKQLSEDMWRKVFEAIEA